MSDLVPHKNRRALAARSDTTPLLAGYEPPPEEFDLRQAFGILRRRALLILTITAVATSAAGYSVFRQQAQYRATAVVRLIDQRRAMTGGLEASASQEMLGSSDDPLLSQIEVLRTRTVARRVVDRLGLRLQPLGGSTDLLALQNVQVAPTALQDTLVLHFNANTFLVIGTRDSIRARYGEPVSHAGVSLMVATRPAVTEHAYVVRPREASVDSLLRHLRATAREKTDVVDVEFTAGTATESQRVVNTIIEEFRALNAHEAQEESRRRRLFLAEQLAEMDSLQRAAQLRLSNFRRREQVFSSREKFATEQASLTGIDVRRQELVADRRMFQSLLSDLKKPQTGDTHSLLTVASSPQISENKVITTLFSQLLSFQAARDSLTFGDHGRATTDPDVQRLDGLIVVTRSKLTDALSGHVDGLNARIAALDDLRGRSSAAMQSMPDAEAEEVRHTQNLETMQKMADQLRDEYQKARIAEAVEGGQVEILDYAALPDHPIPTRSLLKLMLGLLVGLLVASGTAFGVEQMNSVIREPEELEGTLSVPGLAVIPRFEPNPNALSTRLRLTRDRNGKTKRPLITVADSQSTGAEAYRKLRTNLIFARTLNQMHRLLVTSASESEGKSTVTANLGVTFAQQGMRVLLIDGDLRRPSLHKMFAVPQAPGFTQVVLGQESLEHAIRPTRIEGLFVMPAGTLPPNPAELLGQEQTSALLAQLSGEFDMVLIDSSPVAAAADSIILATIADGVLMVVRAGETDRSAAQYAVQQIERVGGKVVGAVLNDPDAKLPRYGQKYAYHYRDYKYGEA
jgi:tyrosine-protein kinase Etk/Wzc